VHKLLVRPRNAQNRCRGTRPRGRRAGAPHHGRAPGRLLAV